MNTNWDSTLDKVKLASRQLVVAVADRPPPNAPEMSQRLRDQLVAQMAELEENLDRLRRSMPIPRIRCAAEVGWETVRSHMLNLAYDGTEWGRIRPVASTVPTGGRAALDDAAKGFLRVMSALPPIPAM